MTGPTHVAWIGLGSNLDGPAHHLAQAIVDLKALPSSRLLAASPFFDTVPVGGPADQPMFCNACVAIATTLMPASLLNRLQAIEHQHGRVRDVRWGPRTLDLDILAFNDWQLDCSTLTVPHPRAHERGFVLAPLACIAPALRLADGHRVIDSLAGVDCAGVYERPDG